MAHDAARPSNAAAYSRHLPGGHTLAVLAIPVIMIAGLAFARPLVASAPALVGLAAGAQDLPPADLTTVAAENLERATRAGGPGYRFQIVQTSTMVAKPGGPRIAVPDPITRGTLRMADSYFLNALIEQGVVRPEGFWSQMRAGPAEGDAPDWTGAHVMYEALALGATRWRNDGDGWYRADALPGIGLDPETAGLLPKLLRSASAAKDLAADDRKFNPGAARNLHAAGKPADIPGLIASDGLPFTELREPIAYGFDEGGRVISITAIARNTNMTRHDLVVETRMTIAYDGVVALPAPKPAMAGKGRTDAHHDEHADSALAGRPSGHPLDGDDVRGRCRAGEPAGTAR